MPNPTSAWIIRTSGSVGDSRGKQKNNLDSQHPARDLRYNISSHQELKTLRHDIFFFDSRASHDEVWAQDPCQAEGVNISTPQVPRRYGALLPH